MENFLFFREVLIPFEEIYSFLLCFATGLINNIPASTTYEAGSITWDNDTGDATPPVSLTDVGGDDEGDYNITNPNSVTVNAGLVGVGITGEIVFKVTVD